MLSLPGVLLMYDDTAFIELSLLLFFSSHFDLFFPSRVFSVFLYIMFCLRPKWEGLSFSGCKSLSNHVHLILTVFLEQVKSSLQLLLTQHSSEYMHLLSVRDIERLVRELRGFHMQGGRGIVL